MLFVCLHKNILKSPDQILKIFHAHVHLNETTYKAKVSDTLLQGQVHSERSKVTCTEIVSAAYLLNHSSDLENISHICAPQCAE